MSTDVASTPSAPLEPCATTASLTAQTLDTGKRKRTDEPHGEECPQAQKPKLAPDPPLRPYDDLEDALTDSSWCAALAGALACSDFVRVKTFLNGLAAKGTVVYPPKDKIFAALNACPLDKVRVCIIGQDCYFHPGQAEGLSFSVPVGVAVPPSLVKIYQALFNDIKGFRVPQHGHLGKWAEQGVLLLNSQLTVSKGAPNSHEKCGWQEFTDRVIDVLNERCAHVVFLLWGAAAQRKGRRVNTRKHKVLEAPHPSPANPMHTKFLECKHFSKANAYLASVGLPAIDWQI